MASLQSFVLRYLIRKTINWNKPLEEVRKFQYNIEQKVKIPHGISIEKITTGCNESEWFIPRGCSGSHTLVYFHGGGYCLGIVNANRNFVMKLASDLNQPIVLLNYRLAPENPFPAALDDAVECLLYLLQKKQFKADQIGIIGDSSGCGLCMAALSILKSRSIPLPAFQVFMTPVVDLTKTGQSFKTKARKDPYQLKEHFFIDNNYTSGLDVYSPLLSPLYGDLKYFPETLIQAAEYDVFLSDAQRLHQKLTEAGVKSHYTLWRKTWHNFQMSAALLPEARKAITDIKNFSIQGFLKTEEVRRNA